jgi:hypothetical protein
MLAFCLSWLWTTVFLISTSHVAEVIGMSNWTQWVGLSERA